MVKKPRRISRIRGRSPNFPSADHSSGSVPELCIYSMPGMRSLFAAVSLFFATLAAAQSYPAKPIHLIVPFPPGGGNDAVARAIAQQVSPDLGQPMVIDNRPGAGGSVGGGLPAQGTPPGRPPFFSRAG